MTTQIENNTTEGLVKDMRTIRDQISLEIKDMTFEQERAYLDQLLLEGNSEETFTIRNSSSQNR